MALSNYLENALLDFLFRGQSLSAPANVYVGLVTAAASDGSIGTEVAYSGYARVAVSSALGSWEATQGGGSTAASSGTAGQIANLAAITFATPGSTVGSPVVGVIIMDASSGGNLLMYGTIVDDTDTPSPKTLTAGDPVSFPIGTLRLRLD